MLITREDVERVALDVTEPAGRRVAGGVVFSPYRRGGSLKGLLPNLQHDVHVHMPCFSRWSMVGLLEHLLSLTGPCHVWLTSWTITEDPMRSLVRMMREGRIVELAALFDDRAPNHNAQGAQLAKASIERLAFVPIHAKVMVLINGAWGVSVTSTANLTRNKRIERYVICTHRSVAEMDRDWIEQYLPPRD